MSPTRRFIVSRRRMEGLSLIEMMIALVMALIVAAGIISVFASTSSSNKVQAQMATLQEEGRFAIQSLRSDLANANGGYCSNSGGNAGVTGSGLFLDALRAPTIYAESAINFTDNTVALLAPTQAYSLPSSIFMRGYDCGTSSSSCKPDDPNTVVSAIPPMGTAVGNRVVGADLLTIRYIKPGSGWAIVPSTDPVGSYITTTGGTTTITLRPLSSEEPASDFTGSIAMLADCSNAQVFDVTNASGTLTFLGPGTPGNYAQPLDITKSAAPRVFDFTKDFQTITYYLSVVDAGNGHTTGELVRRVNGVDQPLVRGVERLDFLYGIIDAAGGTRFLTAEEVDTATDSAGNSIACPPGVAIDGGMGSVGCLWRAVQTVEVHILMDGQTPLYTLAPAETGYIYTPDNTTTPTLPSAHALPPSTQGFPNQLLRREFTTLVALRNFNP